MHWPCPIKTCTPSDAAACHSATKHDASASVNRAPMLVGGSQAFLSRHASTRSCQSESPSTAGGSRPGSDSRAYSSFLALASSRRKRVYSMVGSTPQSHGSSSLPSRPSSTSSSSSSRVPPPSLPAGEAGATKAASAVPLGGRLPRVPRFRPGVSCVA